MEKKFSHKHMQTGERVVEPPIFNRWLKMKEFGIRFDPARQGGFILDKDEMPIGYVRSPYWRATEGNPAITRSDMKPVFLAPKDHDDLDNVESGGELELYAWDESTQESAPIMSEDSPVPYVLKEINGENSGFFVEEDPFFAEIEPSALRIGFSDELARSCIELNFHHSAKGINNGVAMLRALKILTRVVEEQGWRITPISAFAHRPLEKNDTNSHPYVQRIALGYMGWENVRHFLGASWQVHVEMLDLPSALKAINLYQALSPLVYALSPASPFLHGLTKPNLRSIYLEDEFNQTRLNDNQTLQLLDDSDWLSIRYPSRWRGSPSGGNFITPLPEKFQDFLALAESGLRNNERHSIDNLPSPARAAGHHRDRVRIDIGPNGTLEIAGSDNFGGHLLKLLAHQEFTRVLLWKLQHYAKSNRLGELTNQYPALFSYPVTEQLLRESHLNNIEVAKQGTNAIIRGTDGQNYQTKILFERLLEFVNRRDDCPNTVYEGLPQGVISQLEKSAQIPTAELYRQYKDESGITSVRGFYETGVGTLSHWLKRRASDLIERGIRDQEAIKDCMNDLGPSYHAFLRNLSGKDVASLFE